MIARNSSRGQYSDFAEEHITKSSKKKTKKDRRVAKGAGVTDFVATVDASRNCAVLSSRSDNRGSGRAGNETPERCQVE